MKKKLTIAIALIIPSTVLFCLVFSDSHQTNIPYLMWKWGWTHYSPEISMRYMTVDSSFRNSLKGMTKPEVKKWFPDLRKEEKPDQYLDSNQPFYIATSNFLWIGDTQWAIGFEEDKVVEFFLIKGTPKLEDRKFSNQRVDLTR